MQNPPVFVLVKTQKAAKENPLDVEFDFHRPPNSKVTVKIIFKIPSSYKTALPKNWQFGISLEGNANISTPTNTPVHNEQTIKI